MQVSAIIRKDRHRVHLQNTRPTNIHHSFPTVTCRVVQVFTKNSRVRSRGFSKNRDRVAPDFQKTSVPRLRIFQKPQVPIQYFLKISRPITPPSPKISGQGGPLRIFSYPPPPGFLFSQTDPHPPCFAQNKGLPPLASSSKTCSSRGTSGERGRGDHPTGHGLGGWGDRMKWWGDPLTSGLWDTPRPPIRNFSYRPPTSPLRAKRGPHPPCLPVPKGAFRVERNLIRERVIWK